MVVDHPTNPIRCSISELSHQNETAPSVFVSYPSYDCGTCISFAADGELNATRCLGIRISILQMDGGRLVQHARYYWLLLAESHLTRRLFGSMVARIAAPPLLTG